MRDSRYNALAEAAKRIPSQTVQVSGKLDLQTLLLVDSPSLPLLVTAAITVTIETGLGFFFHRKSSFCGDYSKEKLRGQLEYLGDPSPSPLD